MIKLVLKVCTSSHSFYRITDSVTWTLVMRGKKMPFSRHSKVFFMITKICKIFKIFWGAPLEKQYILAGLFEIVFTNSLIILEKHKHNNNVMSGAIRNNYQTFVFGNIILLIIYQSKSQFGCYSSESLAQQVCCLKQQTRSFPQN